MKQTDALNILKTGVNVFLTGEPGAGKTHTINTYIHWLRSHKIQTAITASTGIAATHIGGMTIHSWSGVGINSQLSTNDIHKISNRDTVKKRIEKTHVLIIDEVSMLAPEILTNVNAICQTIKESSEPFGGMQVVFVGDFFQLPPIFRNERESYRFAFESLAWKHSAPITCYITEQFRQDDTHLTKILKAIRTNTITTEHKQLVKSRQTDTLNLPNDIPHLYTHNANVDAYNNQKLTQLPSNANSYTMHTKGAKRRVESLIRGCLSPEKLTLKIGATVMFTKNDQKRQYANGTIGTVTDFDIKNHLPIVTTRNNESITVYPSEWNMEERGKIRATIAQLPLRLAWAVTIHKSQGMTMDAAAMDLSKVFERGQGYVALSRLRSLAGLHLIGCNDETFRIHDDVLEQDEFFRAQSKDAAKLCQTNPAELKATHNDFIFKSGGSINTIEPNFKPLKKTSSKPTRDVTLELWNKKLSVPEIAEQRGLKITSIMKHVEDMVESGKLSREEVYKRLVEPELENALPDIHAAFKTCDTQKLTPIQQHLRKTKKGEFSFKDLRIARLFLD